MKKFGVIEVKEQTLDAQLFESQVGTMYWMMDCMQNICSMLNKVREFKSYEYDVAAELVKHFDTRYVVVLSAKTTIVTLDEYNNICNAVVNKVLGFDQADDKSLRNAAAFDVLEDLLFYAIEFVNALKRIGLSLSLICESLMMSQEEEDEVELALWNRLASEMSFVVEQ